MKIIIDILLFVFFICVFIYSLRKILNRYSRKKILLVGISAFIAVSILYIALALLILSLCKNGDISPQIIQLYCLKIYLSLVVLILVDTFIVVSGAMVGDIISFHKKNNISNIEKQPVKLAAENKKSIVNAYKYFFIVGGCMMLFIIWFLMSINAI